MPREETGQDTREFFRSVPEKLTPVKLSSAPHPQQSRQAVSVSSWF